MTDPGDPGTAAGGTREAAAAPDTAPPTAPPAAPVEPPPVLDRALRGATVAAALGLGAAGLALPDSLLTGGVAWLGFLWCVLAGWGAIVARIARAADLDFGLLTALGAAGYVAL